MRNNWKKLVAAFCAASMLMTLPGVSVYAADSINEDAIESLAATAEVVDASGDTLEEDIILEEAGIPAEAAEPSDDAAFTGMSEEPAETIDPEEVDVPDPEEPVDAETVEQAEGYESLSEDLLIDKPVGASIHTVGNGVSALYDSSEGSIVLYTTGSGTGILWRDWLERAGIPRKSIKSIRVMRRTIDYPLEKVKLPANSRGAGEDEYFVFGGLEYLNDLDLSYFDTSNVTDMSYMFCDCIRLMTITLEYFDTSKVTNMSGIFENCRWLNNLNIGNINTSNVKSMSFMFSNCTSLSEVDLSSFNTSNVTDMSYMFRNCQSLRNLDLTGFNMSKVTNTVAMFEDCTALDILITPSNKKSTPKSYLPHTMYDRNGKSYSQLPVNEAAKVLGRTKELAATIFIDVRDSSHPYYYAIYWAAENGITKGYPDGTFGIDKSCSRGEMVMFLWRYAGQPAPKSVSKSPFKDVPITHTFYKAILWAYQKGITKGYSDGTFGINRNVSRGESMMFLWRLKGKQEPTPVSVSPFTDVPKTHAFYKAILWGYQKKITTGYTSGPKKGTFGINENCTRGQIVTFLYRARYL